VVKAFVDDAQNMKSNYSLFFGLAQVVFSPTLQVLLKANKQLQ